MIVETYTTVRRIGEMSEHVDWDFDWYQHTPNGMTEEWRQREAVKWRRNFRALVDHLEAGGVAFYRPCFLASHRILRAGMYDGWPFWRPTPAVSYIGPLRSVEYAFYYQLWRGEVSLRCLPEFLDGAVD